MIDKTLFSRRIFILMGIKIALVGSIIVRLFFLQIQKNTYFSALASQNHTNSLPLIPKRGVISDYFGRPVATNVTTWQLIFIRSWLKRPLNEFLSTLTKFIYLSSKQIKEITDSYHKNTYAYTPITLKDNLTEQEIATIQSYSQLFPEAFILAKYTRYYPYKESLAHLLGYVVADNNPTSYSWQKGKQGLESSLDNMLKGNLGYRTYEKDAKGRIIKDLGNIPPQSGSNLLITIDADLQEAIFHLIKKASAAVVVLDCESGEILSCVSSPSFNPNTFSNKISTQEWKKLITNPENPLNNRAVAGLYPPASTLKPFVALTALNQGVIDPNTKIECKGYLDIGNQRFHCWKHGGHGLINVSGAIVHSCDVFFYTLAQSLTKANFTELAKLLKVNETLVPLLPSSCKGNLPLHGIKQPHLGELAITGIGQGTWLVTALHLANMANMLANKGQIKDLRILKRLDFNDTYIYSKANQNIDTLPFSQEHMELVLNALAHVVPKDINQKWSLSGKTGTAQVVRITQEQRLKGLTRETKKMYREHAMFSGFTPSETPRYAISIVLEHVGFGSVYALPIAKQITNLLAERSTYYESEKSRVQKIINSSATNDA